MEPPPGADPVEWLVTRYRAVTWHPDSYWPQLGLTDARRFLDDCERLGVTVLGMDFFRGQRGGTSIHAWGGTDYSAWLREWPDPQRRSIAAARADLELAFAGRVYTPTSAPAEWAEFVVRA